MGQSATTLVALKMTPQEIHLLDWLVQHRNYANRSDALRASMLINAGRLGAGSATTNYAIEGREGIKTRKRRRPIKSQPQPEG